MTNITDTEWAIETQGMLRAHDARLRELEGADKPPAIPFRRNAFAFAVIGILTAGLTIAADIAIIVMVTAGNIVAMDAMAIIAVVTGLGGNASGACLALAATMLKPDDPPNPLAEPLRRAQDTVARLLEVG